MEHDEAHRIARNLWRKVPPEITLFLGAYCEREGIDALMKRYDLVAEGHRRIESIEAAATAAGRQFLNEDFNRCFFCQEVLSGDKTPPAPPEIADADFILGLAACRPCGALYILILACEDDVSIGGKRWSSSQN